MNNVIEVQFKNKCCRCDKEATYKIALTNADTCEHFGYKYFCDDHKNRI